MCFALYSCLFRVGGSPLHVERAHRPASYEPRLEPGSRRAVRGRYAIESTRQRLERVPLMNHPLPSEATAFRLVQITIGACVAGFVVATAGGGTADVIAVSHVTAAVLTKLLLLRRGKKRSSPHAPPARPANARHRIVVVATTDDISPLADDVRERTVEHDSDVVLVCPALNSRLAHWVSDVDNAEQAARQRVADGMRALVQAGVDAVGVVGDPNPLQAIEDALWIYGADKLVLATHADDELHWLERNVVERARAHYLIPIEHLVAGQEPAPLAPEPSEPELQLVPGFVAEASVLAASPALVSGPDAMRPMS